MSCGCSPIHVSTLEALTRGFHKNARSRDERAGVVSRYVASPRASSEIQPSRHQIGTTQPDLTRDLTPR
jgi:hypothetical protein